RGVNRLSRFTLRPDWTLDTSSEKVVLEVPSERGMCCHTGGALAFDAADNLYLATGDNTNPFQSNDFSPLDERPERNPQFDAQRTSANTNDLRGKVLRIKVADDGSYTIPPGNLFAPGTAETLPEIYLMGLRNPYKISVDKPTGVLYVGEYGPDANVADPQRGPARQTAFLRATGPGNYGWPYCIGAKTVAETYNHWDFATNTGGPKYDCQSGATNTSFRNTGLAKLPPALPAWIQYGKGAEALGVAPPEFGTGSESPMGGKVYRYDASSTSPTKFPQSYDGHYLAAEFGLRWIMDIEVNGDGSPGAITRFPWTGTQVMDTAFGRNGSLYVLDYGTGWFTGDENSAIYRIDYIKGQVAPPIARATAKPTSGATPLNVTFSSAGSSDPSGGALTYRWDFGDGASSTDPNPTHTYTTDGTYTSTSRSRSSYWVSRSLSTPGKLTHRAETVCDR
ncbi:PKD domain-containing protein, partial [Nocardia sp. NPDC004722]